MVYLTSDQTHPLKNLFLGTIRVCKGPLDFEYGAFIPDKINFEPGDEISFYCYPDYFELEGDTTLKCYGNGDWSGKFPICKKGKK